MKTRKPAGWSTCQSCWWHTIPCTRQWLDTVLTSYFLAGGRGYQYTTCSQPCEICLTNLNWRSLRLSTRRGWKEPLPWQGSSPLKKLQGNNTIMIVEPGLLPYSLGMLLWSTLTGLWASTRWKTGGRRVVMWLWTRWRIGLFTRSSVLLLRTNAKPNTWLFTITASCLYLLRTICLRILHNWRLQQQSSWMPTLGPSLPSLLTWQGVDKIPHVWLNGEFHTQLFTQIESEATESPQDSVENDVSDPEPVSTDLDEEEM